MDIKVLHFLAEHRICVLATVLNDGSPHAAVVHYSHKDSPLELYFSTDKRSRKCQSLLDGGYSKASVVVGFSEDEWKTLQMDGKVKVVSDPEEIKQVQSVYYSKLPDSKKYKDDPETVLLKFVPNWWRYTDFNKEPPTILSWHR